MAVVYNFETHFTIKHLNDVYRSVGNIVTGIGQLKANCARIQKGLKTLEAHHQRFDKDLDLHSSRLDQSLELAEGCSEACELETLEDMVEERDRLLRSRSS